MRERDAERPGVGATEHRPPARNQAPRKPYRRGPGERQGASGHTVCFLPLLPEDQSLNCQRPRQLPAPCQPRPAPPPTHQPLLPHLRAERRGILWRWRGPSGLRWVWRNALGGPRRVGGLLGVAGRLSGTVSPFRAEQGTSLETPSWARGHRQQGCGHPPSPGSRLQWVTVFFSRGSSPPRD